MFYLCNITQKNFCKEGSEFMDIKQLIGEATDYDKKVALEIKKPKSWCKSISAFANCYGGKLVFGVANDDELVGLADAEGDAERISEIIKTHLNPIPEFKLSFEKDKDKTFVIVEVMKGQQTPYYYEGDGQLIAFIRIGNESVPATPSQLRDFSDELQMEVKRILEQTD